MSARLKCVVLFLTLFLVSPAISPLASAAEASCQPNRHSADDDAGSFVVMSGCGAPHFVKTDFTPQWMNVYGFLTIGGAPADLCDEVAVFDSDGVLAGAGILLTPGVYTFIAVYGDEPSTPSDEGATMDDLLTFKVWDSSWGIELDVVAIAIGDSPDPARWKGDRLQFRYDLQASIPPAALTLIKTVVNDDGGAAVADDFKAYIDGNEVPWNVPQTLAAGDYVVSEDVVSGYMASDWGGDCNPDGTISLVPGQVAECTITNDDIAPTLKLVKAVDNTGGGTAVADDWTLSATAAAPDDGRNFSNAGGSGVFETVFANAGYELSESGPAGYDSSGWSCDGGTLVDSTVTLSEGETGVTCTITNTYIPPEPAALTLIKTVANDDGGAAVADDFKAYIDGNEVPWNVPQTLAAGDYVVSEDVVSGYMASDWGGDCNPDGTISLVPGQVAECTITNDDIAPTLTLVKTVDGGPLSQGDFQAYIDGSAVPWDDAQTLSAGAHTVSEDTKEGYTASSWEGDCNPDGSISLSLGQNATCTITNTYTVVPPATLILVKTVVNDDGGTAVADDFTVCIDNQDDLLPVCTPLEWGPIQLQPATYCMWESGPDGYSSSGWLGDCSGGCITLTAGMAASCSVTNDDIAPTLKVTKTVVNDGGGMAVSDDFQAYIDGTPVPWDDAQTLSAGAHTVSEDTKEGYTASAWEGDCNPDGSISLSLGQKATCTISNTFAPSPSLTLQPKTATNILPGDPVHTVTATLLDALDVPMAGHLISFKVISGPNEGRHSIPGDGNCDPLDCTTDGNGQVSWTYTGSNRDTDSIEARFENGPWMATDESNKTWLKPNGIPGMTWWSILLAVAAIAGVALVMLRKHILAGRETQQ